jgi:hypothetical protein
LRWMWMTATLIEACSHGIVPPIPPNDPTRDTNASTVRCDSRWAAVRVQASSCRKVDPSVEIVARARFGLRQISILNAGESRWTVAPHRPSGGMFERLVDRPIDVDDSPQITSGA